MEYVSCDFCGSQQSDVIIAQKDIVHRCAPADEEFYLHKCRQCGLVYLNPRPSMQELYRFYPESYECHSGRMVFLYKLREFLTYIISIPYLNRLIALGGYFPFIRERFIKLVQPRMPDYLRKMNLCKLLDVGCGSGLNTHFYGHRSSLYRLRKHGIDAIGLEPIFQARAIALKRGIKVFSSFSELEGQTFDCIRVNWSLEHVDSPSRILEAFHKLLLPGGKLIIAVPNYDGLIYRLYPDCVEVPLHCYYFTPKTLEAYFNKYCFKLLDCYTFSYPGMFVLGSKVLGKTPPFNLTPLEAIHFQEILKKFDNQMFGNDMVYLCEKAG